MIPHRHRHPVAHSREGRIIAHGERHDDLIGRTIGPYRILSRLGEGGMGVVYLAEHTKLHKTVAMKFLRRESLADDDSRRRFVKEARAAAALDHGSICAVYDFDDSRDRAYISMAYLEGRSLAELLREGPLPIERALLVAIQVAEGLAAAHAAGILHRDVKPSNILFTAGGQAKIADFGLARIKDTSKITRTGLALGTAAYMSPEQATGREVDHRTDIWSLGAVLYEMIAGRPPFLAEYEEAVLYAVTHEDPAPLADARPGTPPEADWIAGKCLARDPADRYEDCAALLGDLRNLRRKLTGGASAPRPSWILESRGRLLVGGLSILALAAAITLAAVLRPWEGGADVFRRASSLQVTSDEAWEGDPTISPDGTRIAYSKCIAGNHDIYVINARGGTPLRLTADPAEDRDPCWMPDGSGILFASRRLGEASIWRVDPQGGPESLVLEDAMDPAVSPDGERLACGRIDEQGAVRIALASLVGGTDVRLLTGDTDGPGGHRHPAWSPDGEAICYATENDLWIVGPAGGPGRRLTVGGIADDHPAWSADGEQVYFGSFRGNAAALWRVGAGGGAPERLTFGTSGESHPSLDRDGSRLAYAIDSGENDEDVVILDRLTGQEHRLAGEAHDSFQPTISADGSVLAFVSDREEGRNEIWLQGLVDGRPSGEPRRLTDQPGNACHPALSPDGRWVAYYRYEGERRDVWVVPTQGGTPRRITDDDADDRHVGWSPDGRTLAFASDRGGDGLAIWTVPIEEGHASGEFRRITPAGLPALFPSWSPDGRRIAFLGHEAGHNYVYVTGSDGAGEPRRIDVVADACRSCWEAGTGRLWICARWDDGPLSVRAVLGDPAEAVDLDPPLVLNPALEYGLFDISGDGQLVVYSYPERTGDVWLLELGEGAF